MKGIFVLAVLAAAFLWLSMPAGAQPPDISNDAHDSLSLRIEGVGHTLSGHYYPDECEVVDGLAVCTFELRRGYPPTAYRLYWDGVLYDRRDGEISCYQLPRYERTNCVWGDGFEYTITVTVDAGGATDFSYTHKLQEWYHGLDAEGNPVYGPIQRQHGMVILGECRETVKNWREGGKIGPAPECRARTWRYEQDAGTVAVE